MAAKKQAKPAVEVVDDADVPKAKVVDREDPMFTAKVLGFVGVVALGWVFVLVSNKFHVTAPVVFVCLGWVALLFTVLNLWRTGAAAAGPASEDEGWGRPIGARGELEKEKRTLLKGIKEAEFDAAMGKLSKADSESMIRDYRARAIEVIKELDRLSAGATLSTKEQIAQEVRARMAIAHTDKVSNRSKNAAAKQQGNRPAEIEVVGSVSPLDVIDPIIGHERAEALRRDRDLRKVGATALAEQLVQANDEAEEKERKAAEAVAAKAKAEADAIALKAQQAQDDKIALAEARAAAAKAEAEAAEARAAAARAAAEAVEARAVARLEKKEDAS